VVLPACKNHESALCYDLHTAFSVMDCELRLSQVYLVAIHDCLHEGKTNKVHNFERGQIFG